MASITIRDLDNEVKSRLRVLAAQNGRSMEEEVRIILRGAVGRKSGAEFIRAARTRFTPDTGVDVALPQRSNRPLPTFGDT